MKLKTFFTVLAGVGTALVNNVSGEPVNVGDAAPAPEVKNQDGEVINLADSYKTGLVLIYFYPKADTPGCTAQACSLRDSFAVLTDKGVTVYGVSMDTQEEQKAFQDSYHLPFDLIADPDGKLVDGFGVPRKGRFANRQAFLIDEGKIVWRDLSASTKKQADDVLAVLAEMKPEQTKEE